MKIPRAKQARAAKMLHNAWLHIYEGHNQSVQEACDILSEAERYVRNGFRMPNWRSYFPFMPEYR